MRHGIHHYKLTVLETLFSYAGASMSGQFSEFITYRVALDLAAKSLSKRSSVGKTKSTGQLSLDKFQTSQSRRSELPLELIRNSTRY